MAEPQYRRLTRGRARRVTWAEIFTATRSSLWLGQDHVLCIDTVRYTEEYKRFYFRDIQAITISPTRRRAVWNGVLSGALVLSFAALATAFGSGTMLVVSGVLFGVPLAINNLMGTACKVRLRTAVQDEYLPSLSRVGRTRTVLARILPLIYAAQGSLTPEEIAQRLAEAAASAPPPNAPPPMSTSPLGLSAIGQPGSTPHAEKGQR